MSGLAALLAGREVPGVVQWISALDPADVGHAVEHAGWAFGYVDGWRATTKAEVLEAIGVVLGFAEHYGRNLDALADCLSETDADRGTVLLWDGWGTLAREDRRSFDLLVQVLRERTAATGSPFAVLLRGEGPDLPDVPVLT